MIGYRMGEFIHNFGHKGSGQGQFSYPLAVIVDSNNRVIVSEDGGWLSTIDGKGTGNSNFYYPQGLALDPMEIFIL